MRHISHTRRFATATFLVAVMLALAFGTRLTLAQDPEVPVPEPGYIVQPGEDDYVIVPTPSPDGVQGEAEHECEDDPLRADCDPAPPTNLRMVRSGAKLSVQYTRSRWRGSNTHWYRFELHRSPSRNGTYTLDRFVWDGVSPAEFNGVTRGYYYKARAKRCRTVNVNQCGEWTSFVGPTLVPKLPTPATSPRLTRGKARLTATYQASGSTYDVIDIDRRRIGSTTPSPFVDSNRSRMTSSTRTFGSNADRGYEYRFRVRRCLDSARNDCSPWTAWTNPWLKIPKLATSLSLSRTKANLTASYSREGTTYDVIDMDRRLIGSTGSGGPETGGNITGASYSRNNVDRGYEYRFRVRRCVDSARSDCGGTADWSDWSPWKVVPKLARDLTLTRSKRVLTVKYSAEKGSYDEVDIDRREIDDGGEIDDDGIEHFARVLRSRETETSRSFTRHVVRGYEYRFRVRRCVNSARSDCGGNEDWSDWSGWKVVPKLATSLGISRVKDDLTATYSKEGTTYDLLDMNRRLIDALGDGDSEFDGIISSTSFGRNNVDRGYEYRFRVKRCVDSGLTDCGGDDWSDWSPWKVVPKLAKDLTLTRSKRVLTVKYNAEKGSYDEVDIDRREIDDGGEIDDDGIEHFARVLRSRETETSRSFTRHVVRGYEYRFRVRRCVNSARSDCGGNEDWSDWSGWKVVPKLATSLGISRVKDDLTATYSKEGTSHDVIDMDRRLIGSTGTGSSEAGGNITSTRYSRSNVDRGYEYRFRVRRCVDSARSDCGGNEDWSDWSGWKVVPKLATSLGISRVKDDLTATYSKEGTSHDVIDMDRRRIGSTGSGSSEAGGNITSTRYSRSNVDRGYEYRFRVRRCVDSVRDDCGGTADWSSWSAWKAVPKLATGLRLSRSKAKLTATYTRERTSYDVIDVDGRTIDSTGDGSAEADEDISGSGYSLDVDRGDEYRFRVRRCVDSARSDCGGDDDWSGWSDWKPVPNLPTQPGRPTITVNDDDLTVSYTDTGTSSDQMQFQQSDSETSGFTDYTGGTLSGKVLSNVVRNKWYQVRVRRCTDAAFTDCTDWSRYSDAVKVALVPVQTTPTITSGADGMSAVANFTLISGFTYTLTMYSSPDGKTRTIVRDGRVTPEYPATSHIYKGLLPSSGLEYQAVLRACKSGTCIDYNSNTLSSFSKGPAPTITGITLTNEDDLEVVFTKSDWTDGAGKFYDFKIRRGDSSSSAFVAEYGDADRPKDVRDVFNNVHTGYYYKALSRRCSDMAVTVCGDWSDPMSGVNVPGLSALGPPTNIQVSIVSHREVKADFERSTRPARTPYRYVFQIGQSDTQAGTYVYGSAKLIEVAIQMSEVSFGSLKADKWYKVRGKRCYDEDRKRCGSWAVSASAVETVSPDPKLKLVGSKTTRTIGAGLPELVFVDATGLDRTKQYTVQFRSSEAPETPADPEAEEDPDDKATRKLAKVLKFDNCNAADPRDSNDEIVPAGSSRRRVSVRTLYGCAAGSDVVTASLVQGSSTLATVEVTFVVIGVPEPTELRVDGDNRGEEGDVQFEIAWKSVAGATGYEVRYAEECTDRVGPCSSLVSTWLPPAPVSGNIASPYTVTIGPPGDAEDTLYRVEMSAIRNGVRSAWSKPIFVYPSDGPPTGLIATIPFYGHHADREYTFRICDDTFPDESGSSHDDWVDSILNGAESWQEALNWTSSVHGENRNFASVSRDTSKVGTNDRDTCPTSSVLGLVPDVAQAIPFPGVRLFGFVSHLGLWAIGRGDLNYPYAELRFVRRETLIARCLGYRPSTKGCAPPRDGVDSLSTFEIFTNRSLPDDIDVLLHADEDWMSSRGTDAEKCTFLQSLVAHEVGHALGVSGLHTKSEDLLMHTNVPTKACGPQPYDVAAMLSNYQSLR